MSMSVGASSNALSYLQSLLAQGTAGANDAAGASDPLSALLQTLSGATADSSAIAAAPAGGTAGTGCSSFDSGTMAALISLQGQSASGVTAQSPSPLFSKLDTDGDGQISKSEFENALGDAGVGTSSADALFAKLDANGDGSISQSELTQARRRWPPPSPHAWRRRARQRFLRPKRRRCAAVGYRRERRDHPDYDQRRRIEHDDDFLRRRQRRRDDDARGAGKWLRHSEHRWERSEQRQLARAVDPAAIATAGRGNLDPVRGRVTASRSGAAASPAAAAGRAADRSETAPSRNRTRPGPAAMTRASP